MVAMVIIGCGLAVIIGAVVWLLRQGKGSRRSRVPYWGYGPRGPYGNWYRDPWSVGERVGRSIEKGQRRSAQQRFSSRREKRTR
jgi:hypothetical protein